MELLKVEYNEGLKSSILDKLRLVRGYHAVGLSDEHGIIGAIKVTGFSGMEFTVRFLDPLDVIAVYLETTNGAAVLFMLDYEGKERDFRTSFVKDVVTGYHQYA